ncbi:MAG TPA: pitrilysin family protein [Burkholderiales bacterium]
MTRSFAARCAVLVAALCCAPAIAADAQQRILGNGMKVIVKEDHRSPIAVSMVWYRAGSMDEVSGNTGVAHVLEHMMFKGTKKVPAGEFSRIVARAGGRDNAFTSRDYTAYHQQLHKSKLPLVLELEADRMANLVLSEDEFSKEIRVVMEERRMRTEDDAHSQVSEQMMASVYVVHPYRTPVVGWMNDLVNMRVKDARAWYDTWYVPNNATLVVAGDVVTEEVFSLAEKFFGPIPSRPLPERKPQVEPKQSGIKRLTVKAPGELPYVLMAYHVPVLRDPEKDWEPYALSVLNGVLDGYDAARLNRELVKTSRIANDAGASYDGVNRGEGLFYLDGTPAEGRTAPEIEEALRGQIARVVKEGISEQELRRVKAQVTASQVFSQDSVYYQATRIGMLETVGIPHQTADLQVRKLQEVTAEQVREVARKYLVDDNLTVAVLDPQLLPGGKKPRPRQEGARDVQ